MLGSARAALLLLSRLPVGRVAPTDRDWRWAAAWFPSVGAALALPMIAAWVVGRTAGPTVAALCAVGAGLLITGALHEDGLADTADALGGGRGRGQILAILKDSRIGAYGALALIMVLGLRIALLSRLDDDAPAALILSQACSRLPPAWLIAVMPHVSRSPRTPAAFHAGWPQALVASAGVALLLTLGTLASVWPAARAGLVGVGLAAVICGCRWRFGARLGGVTGDLLGASEQIGQVVVLLVLAAGPAP